MAEVTYVAVFEDVRQALAGVAPSVRGNVSKGINTAPPLYRWFWIGVGHEGAKNFNPTTSRTLGDEMHRAIVEIWARDEDGAMAMRRALINAARQSLGFGRVTIGETEVTEPWTDTDGIKVGVSLTLRLPAVDVFLPPETPAAKAGANPARSVVDADFPLATVSAVEDATPATSTPDDGELEFTE